MIDLPRTLLRILPFIAYFILSPYASPAEPRLSYPPENTPVRKQFEDDLFSDGTVGITAFSVEEFIPQTGTHVRVETAEQENSWYYLFLNRYDGSFPIAAPGNWIIRRSMETGEFEQAKIFLQADEGTFIRLFPLDTISHMDVYLQGMRIHHNIPVRAPFEELLLRPFSRLIELTRFVVDWESLLPQEHRAGDDAVATLVDAIRQDLSKLPDSDDGALDSDGTFRFIEDLSVNTSGGFNCSGFAKWVVDGMIYPTEGKYLSIEQLKEKHLPSRGNEWSLVYEDDRDPYFGLDWTRNLAVYARDPAVSHIADPECADVRLVRGFDYIEDIGYRIADLPVILYYLALDHPGYIYLGSVNQLFGTEPVLRQHVHVVVLMPYFDDHDRFHIVVMERNVESSVQSLATRYPGDYIHLVGLKTDGRFTPLTP